MRRFLNLGLAVVFLFAGVALVWGQPEKNQKGKGQQQQDELTLEKLFPEKSFFGPSARGVAFSADGRYAAYLYRPYLERRHGNDLWMLDTKTGKNQRITSVSVMAEFQKDTRKVRDDRIEKARRKARQDAKQSDEADDSKAKTKKKNKKKKNGDSDQAKQNQADRESGDWVDESDADDEDAPRYSGIGSIEWSPTDNELLFVSSGDVYRYRVGDKGPTRLTRTQTSEGSVRYLPDGSGYTMMQDGAVVKVRFDSHLLMQLDPQLPSGEEMVGYRLSPDGQRLVLMASKGDSRNESGRKVKIVNYRDRFAEVREVNRHMADDPLPERETIVYLFNPDDELQERGQLTEVLRTKSSGPRDVVSLPDWSLDSQRICFAVFEQAQSEVRIYDVPFPVEKEKSDDDESTDDKSEDSKEKQKEKDDDKSSDKPDDDSSEKKNDEIPKLAAQPVHRFLHVGGPNTPRMIRPYFMEDHRRILFLSEQTGFRHLHILNPVYESLQQVTSGHYEVYPVDISRDHKTMFVTATKEHPARQHVYKIDLAELEMTALTSQEGNYDDVGVNDQGTHVVANYVRFGQLQELVHVPAGGDQLTAVTESHPDLAKELTQAVPEIFSYPNRHGHEIYGQLFKPDGWKKNDKRPVLIYVYGGPLGTRKMVVDGSYSADSYFFAWYMAKKHGYVTCTIDPRGVSGYGALFEKSNFEQVGKPQVEDLVDGVKHLVENYGVDADRVAIHGWSFGGFQTQMCMYTEPEVFQVGIAGAGPTEWENYNSWYTTGTIGSSREGQADLKKFSLLPLAKNLKGKLLLVHGVEDSNVLYQDTVNVYRELLKADKETLVELFIDPTGGHGLGGDVSRLKRYRKYEEFLTRNVPEE